MTHGKMLSVIVGVTCVVLAPTVLRAQVLETETARPLQKGVLEIGAGYEFQHSREGDEVAIPLAFELGLTNRLGLLVEPVPYTAIRPEVGTSATGPGDLEVTLSFLARHESSRIPAVALAVEEKIPTARNTLIGTGRADHTAYIIGSKRLNRFDVHANFGYTIVGSPKGQSLSNRIMGALASEFTLTPSTLLYGEVLASTSAGGGEGTTAPAGAPAAPEVSGDEILMTFGVAHSFDGRARYSFGITRDNVGAIQLRPGITLWFR
jgi:hypothetical protein